MKQEIETMKVMKQAQTQTTKQSRLFPLIQVHTPPGQQSHLIYKTYEREGSNLAQSVGCDWSEGQIAKERLGMQRRLDYLRQQSQQRDHQRSITMDFELGPRRGMGQLKRAHESFASM